MANTRWHSLWQQVQEAMLVDMAISKIMPHEVDSHHRHQSYSMPVRPGREGCMSMYIYMLSGTPLRCMSECGYSYTHAATYSAA